MVRRLSLRDALPPFLARPHRAFCLWCLAAAASTFAAVPLALPEARDAAKSLGSRIGSRRGTRKRLPRVGKEGLAKPVAPPVGR